jgi:hypothetical protein
MAGFQTMSGIPKVTSTANFYSNTNPLLQSRGIGGFAEPSALFGNSEQGAWWDFSDLDNMYQDSLGVTKAALEQPVGLVIDKRINQGGRGQELIKSQLDPNRNAGWGSSNSGILSTDPIAGTLTVVQGAADFGQGIQNLVTVANTMYEVVFTVTGDAGNTWLINVGGAGFFAPDGRLGTQLRKFFTATGVSTSIVFAHNITNAVNSKLTITMSIKAAVGNHLIQPTAGARPILSRRYNLCLNTRQYVGWTVGAGVTFTLQPNGLSTDTAARLTYTGGVGVATDARFENPTVSVPGGTANQPFTEVVYIKSANQNNQTCRIKLTHGAVIDRFSTDLTITPAWQPYTVSFTNGVGAGTGTMVYGICADTANNAFDVQVARFDVRLTPDVNLAIPSYQWVDTATSYDTLGFPAYLLFDGATKWMQSASAIPFSGQQATLIAGTAKLSDSVVTSIVELGINPVTSAGFGALNLSATQFEIDLFGNARRAINPTVSAAPYNSVLSVQFDVGAVAASQISAALNNVIPAAATSGDTLGGNVPNSTVYVGARAGTSLFWNGRMFGLILRNALTNANDFDMTNKWMGSKCGLFF